MKKYLKQEKEPLVLMRLHKLEQLQKSTKESSKMQCLKQQLSWNLVYFYLPKDRLAKPRVLIKMMLFEIVSYGELVQNLNETIYNFRGKRIKK